MSDTPASPLYTFLADLTLAPGTSTGELDDARRAVVIAGITGQQDILLTRASSATTPPPTGAAAQAIGALATQLGTTNPAPSASFSAISAHPYRRIHAPVPASAPARRLPARSVRFWMHSAGPC